MLNGHTNTSPGRCKASLSFTKEANCLTTISDAAGLAKKSMRAAPHRAAHHPPVWGSGCDAITILVLSRQHPFAGTSRSRRRTRFTLPPARADRASPSSPQSGRGHSNSGQSAVITGFPLSTIPRKPSPDKFAAAPSPHRFHTGSFFGGFSDAGPIIGPPLAPGPASETCRKRVVGRSRLPRARKSWVFCGHKIDAK